MMTRLGPSAHARVENDASASRTSEKRNIMVFLLRIRNLSRRNWDLRTLGAEVDSWKPLPERGERDVEEADLEHGEEWHGNKLPVLNREPNKVGKIERESHFCDREKRLERHVSATTPRLRFMLDAVFRRAAEIGLVIEDGFENGARIVKREANSERE